MFIDYVTVNAAMSQAQPAMYLTAYNEIFHAYAEEENALFNLNCRRASDSETLLGYPIEDSHK